VILGQVRYCQRSGDLFRAGVEIQDALFGGSSAGDHLDEDSLSLYGAGHGLTASEVLRFKRHLEGCAQCVEALKEATEFYRRLHGDEPTEL
jgi:hypothetical protein